MAKQDKRKIVVIGKDGIDSRSLRGASMNISEMNIVLYGCMDPDTEMLRGVSREMREAAIPKLRRGNPFGIPIIFGTGGSMDGSDYFKRVMEQREGVNIPFDKKLYPVTPEDAFRKKALGYFMLDPVSDVKGWVDLMHESIDSGEYMEPKEVVDKLSKR